MTIADGPSLDDAADAAAMARYAEQLADAVEGALSDWVRHAVLSRYREPLGPEIEAQLSAAGLAAEHEIGPRLRELLALDIDDQWTNPLAIIRTAAAYPTSILRAIGVDHVERDETARRLHPDDVYDLAPASFGDLGSSVHEPGLTWGAAKAHLHIQRRKRQETT